MKWAQIETVEDSQKLLYWVLMYVLSPYFDDPIDHRLKRIMTKGGGIGGDPGWEMEHIPDENGYGKFLVWADPEVSGIEPASATYSKEVVEEALRESLVALGEVQPELAREVKEVIAQYELDR